MRINKHYHKLALLVFSQVLRRDIFSYASGDRQCDFNSTEDLWSETEGTFNAMLQTYEQGCGMEGDCMNFKRPMRSLTVKDYASLKPEDVAELMTGDINSISAANLNFYEQYHHSCAARGMEMCYVTTTTKLNSADIVDTNILAAVQVIRELNKPICFPKSCTEDQVDFLNPYPSACTLAGNICEIVDVEVNCPESREVEDDNFYCEGQAPGPLTNVNLNKVALVNQMDAKCAEIFVGGQNEFCLVQHWYAEVVEVSNYTDFKNDEVSYQRFRTNCRKKGGQECFADFNLLRSIQLGPSSGINYNITGVDYPYCFPTDCTDDSLTRLGGEVILTNFGTVDVGGDIGTVDLCNLPNGGCYFGYNFYCGERENLAIQSENPSDNEAQSVEISVDKSPAFFLLPPSRKILNLIPIIGIFFL